MSCLFLRTFFICGADTECGRPGRHVPRYPTAAPADTTTTAVAADDPAGDEVTKLLGQLNDANAKGDPLSDVPELK